MFPVKNILYFSYFLWLGSILSIRSRHANHYATSQWCLAKNMVVLIQNNM